MILSKTPLRISFFGGGTDFPEYFIKNSGAVLGVTIDKYIYHSIIPFHSHLFDYSIRIAYSKVECVKSLSEIQHKPFREVLKTLEMEKDIEISITADLPSFSGLGSSSSFVVGLINSLLAHKGCMIPKIEMAYKAIEIERNQLNESVGCQDQVFAAVGGFNLIEFINENNIIVNKVPLTNGRMKEFNDSLMMFYTGIKRSASKIEGTKIKNIENINKQLSEMRRFVDVAYNLLTSGKDLSEFGYLLDKNWKLKKELTKEVSNPVIDTMYENAINAGALGGKILGAGGGGFLLVYVPIDRKEKVRKALDNYYEIDFKINSPGTHIVHC